MAYDFNLQAWTLEAGVGKPFAQLRKTSANLCVTTLTIKQLQNNKSQQSVVGNQQSAFTNHKSLSFLFLRSIFKTQYA